MRLGFGAATAATDAVTQQLDGGRLLILDGAIMLASFPFSSPAFSGASAGIAKIRPLPAVRATATGTASSFRAVSRAGETVLDGTVGTEWSGADLMLGSTSIQLGAEVVIESLEYRTPRE